MIAYQLHLPNKEVINISFEKNTSCELIVGGKRKYIFHHDDKDKLKVTWEIEHLSSEHTSPISFFHDFAAISKMEAFHLEAESPEKLNCVTCNGEEYCIKHGCAQTPCGERICG